MEKGFLGEQRANSVLFVLLGASNLSRAYYGFIKHLERCLYPRSALFLNALGPGRGYCVEGGLLNIVYPAIKTCGILDAARTASAGRVVALATDIGNDIMFNVTAEKIIADLAELFEKLHAMDADILVTPIPRYLENGLDDFHFKCLRALFYPGSRINREEAVSAVCEINRFLKSSASNYITLISGLESYYGIDKIHFSPFKMHVVWTRIAGEILRVLNVESAETIGFSEILRSLGAQVLRLALSDMASIRGKGPGYF